MPAPDAFTCDSSLLTPALAPWHPGHADARAQLGRLSAVPVHCLAETYSNLTGGRLGQRASPRAAAAALARLPLPSIALPAEEYADVIAAAADAAVSGGAIYDALIAATARHHGMVLLSRDRRAERTYRALGAQFELLA